MARLGDLDLRPRPVDVAVRECAPTGAETRRWSVLSLDVYGAPEAPRADERLVFASPDHAAVLAFLEAEGYVPAADGATFRLYDETCGRCGAYVPAAARELTTEGWRDGREYRRFGGRLQILRVRCPAHPFDVEESVRSLSEAGLL